MIPRDELLEPLLALQDEKQLAVKQFPLLRVQSLHLLESPLPLFVLRPVQFLLQIIVHLPIQPQALRRPARKPGDALGHRTLGRIVPSMAEAPAGNALRFKIDRRLAYSAFQHAHSASHVHGLIVMRRAVVEAVLAATTDIHPMADWLLTRLVAQSGGVLHLPIVGRHWRQHPRQVHRTADPAVVRRIRQTIDQATNPWR
jgi:hypothetical protein